MYNLATVPEEQYGFRYSIRSKELFKIITIASPYCFSYESSLFPHMGLTTLPDIEDYERLLAAIGDKINLHPYILAAQLPEAPWFTEPSIVPVVAQLRVLWHQHQFRGVVNQNRNRNVVQIQFQSALNPDEENVLMQHINTLAAMTHKSVKI